MRNPSIDQDAPDCGHPSPDFVKRGLDETVQFNLGDKYLEAYEGMTREQIKALFARD